MPVEYQQAFSTVLCGRGTGFGDHALVSVRRQRDGAFEGHVHRRHAQRSAWQHQAVHAFSDSVTDDIGGVDVGSGGQVRAVLFDAARRQDYQRVAFELASDLRLGQVNKISAG